MRDRIKTLVRTAAKAFGVNRLFWNVFKLLETEQTVFSSGGLPAGPVFGHFRDSRGHEYSLIDGLRDHLKPNWRTMFRASPETRRRISKGMTAKTLDDWVGRIGRIERFLAVFSSTLEGKVVVEIGAYDGATAYAVARAGAERVIGTDIAAYYIRQTPGEVVSTESESEKNLELTRQRDAFRRAVGEEIGSRVSFLEDDICSSTLDSQSFDVILSWEVLEHLKDPARALQEMFRVLKPGGIAFHEYNPFFAQDGGHSLCTLDFPWGHARLSPADFERYLLEIRPSEREVATRFYRESLNRMTIGDLARFAAEAEFSVLALLPWAETRHLDELTDDVFEDSRDSFPSCELTDLISPTVWVLLKKERPRR